MTADPAAFRERILARLVAIAKGEPVPAQPVHDTGTALGRKRNRNTIRNGQRLRMLTDNEWKRTVAHFGGKCVYCGEAADLLEKEHFVPLALGGNLQRTNIVPACRSCNRRKHDQHPKDFMAYNPDGYAAIVAYLASLEKRK